MTTDLLGPREQMAIEKCPNGPCGWDLLRASAGTLFWSYLQTTSTLPTLELGPTSSTLTRLQAHKPCKCSLVPHTYAISPLVLANDWAHSKKKVPGLAQLPSKPCHCAVINTISILPNLLRTYNVINSPLQILYCVLPTKANLHVLRYIFSCGIPPQTLPEEPEYDDLLLHPGITSGA